MISLSMKYLPVTMSMIGANGLNRATRITRD